MRFRVELSKEAQKQLPGFPRDVRERIERAIDEFEEKEDSQWSNVKALQGPEWKGRFRKRVGPYRIVFRKFPDRGGIEISDTYR
jgi:mRNA-degrading endonuclease RelE of RelBE toxin-antitoxin system